MLCAPHSIRYPFVLVFVLLLCLARLCCGAGYVFTSASAASLINWCIDKRENNDHFHDALKWMRTKAHFFLRLCSSFCQSGFFSSSFRPIRFFAVPVWFGQPSSGRNELTLRQHKCLNLVAELYEYIVVACYVLSDARAIITQNGPAQEKPKK